MTNSDPTRISDDQHNNAPAVPQGVPEINYPALIEAAFAKNRKWTQGTTGCIAFARGAEWFRELMLAATPAPAPAPAQGEPFGYFRAEPFGWTDCSEDADGAIALYEHPAKPAQDVGLTDSAGLSMLIAGAMFDFGGYLTTHPDVIDVGSTALAGPVADRIKAFAAMRGLSLDDAAVLSWSEGIAAIRAKEQA